MKPRFWLKEIRIETKKTQLDVSNASNISRSYYTKIELGLKTPTVDVAKRIANVLGFDWTIFFKVNCSLKEQNKTA